MRIDVTVMELVKAAREMGAVVQMSGLRGDDSVIWAVVAVHGDDAQLMLDAIAPLTAEGEDLPKYGDLLAEVRELRAKAKVQS